LKDALLAEIRKSSPVLYNTLIAQAQTMEVDAGGIVLRFAASQKIGSTFDKYKPALEAIAAKLAGRKIAVVAETSAAPGGAVGAATASAAPAAPDAADKKAALREQALADSGVQALLEVFPAEIRDVEEM
jgi:hypothetical protein